MSGHNKWSTIKRKKKIKDEKRGKLFSKLTNEIKSLSKNGVDVKKNFKLKNAIARALNKNINKSTIENIIHKENNNKCKSLYAIAFKNNSVFILECFESNEKKMVFNLKHISIKFSGNLISYSNVLNLFDKFININLSNDYNEEYILYHSRSISIYNFINNQIIVKSKYAKDIIIKLRLINLNIDYTSKFIAKKPLLVNDDYFNKLLKLKKKLIEKINISNIFTNVLGL